MFSEKTLRFLKVVSRKNSLEWFESHKDEYEEFVRRPFQELILFLGSHLKTQYPGFRFSPRSVSRITRSHAGAEDRGLYKNWVHCTISNSSKTRFEWPPCLYLYVSPDEIFFGAGLYRPSSPQLKKVRMALSSNPESFASLLKKKSFRDHFSKLAGEDMVRGPKGFEISEKYRPLIMKKGYYVHQAYTKREFYSSRFKERVLDSCRAAQPLVLWLIRVVGTPNKRY
jgi:uncharacterized protein (TIGR02453 family)